MTIYKKIIDEKHGVVILQNEVELSDKEWQDRFNSVYPTITEKDSLIFKISELESEQTPRLIREATLGNDFAKNKLLKINNNIEQLRQQLQEIK
jgi:hypothetical protein